jgi:HSP20 family protein
MINHIKMKLPNHKKADYHGYPGLYQPLRANHERLITGNNDPDVKISKLPINITEAGDMYKIDILIPGFKREQIFIEANGDRLLIEAGKQRQPLDKKEYCRTMEYECEYLRREVIVPGNVDTGFLSAEYRDGILTICMFRTNSIIRNDIAEIAVY